MPEITNELIHDDCNELILQSEMLIDFKMIYKLVWYLNGEQKYAKTFMPHKNGIVTFNDWNEMLNELFQYLDKGWVNIERRSTEYRKYGKWVRVNA